MVTTFPVVTPCGEKSLVLCGNFIETKTTSVGKKKKIKSVMELSEGI